MGKSDAVRGKNWTALWILLARIGLPFDPQKFRAIGATYHNFPGTRQGRFGVIALMA